MMRPLAIACLALVAAAPDAPFNPEGYRIAHYRGPIPAPPPGVSRTDPANVAKLRTVVLIDVLPAEGAARDANGTWRLAQPRPSLPGAHWFPGAGRGDPSPDIAAWFEHGVARLTHGDKARTIVTFCLADCWMSWNAAKRLHALGYTHVQWLSEGTDGWRDAGLPLVDATPEPE